MKRPFLGGNWKLQGDQQFTRHLLSALLQAVDAKVETVVFPPYPYLALAHELAQSALGIGGQNCSQYAKGAYTGEVAASMLKDVGATWVLLGHSERRHLYGETEAMLVEKLLQARAAGLKIVFCVGETEAERRAGKTEAVILRQLAILEGQPTEDLVIAYEPVWAIGTGLTPTIAEIQAVHRKIREGLAKPLRILYGGSLKLENAAEIFALPEVDGGLVGGASLEAKSFLGLQQTLSRSK